MRREQRHQDERHCHRVTETDEGRDSDGQQQQRYNARFAPERDRYRPRDFNQNGVSFKEKNI